MTDRKTQPRLHPSEYQQLNPGEDLQSSARTDTDVLHRAIMHHGGEARNSVQAFIDMPVSEKIALATFLLTL